MLRDWILTNCMLAWDYVPENTCLGDLPNTFTTLQAIQDCKDSFIKRCHDAAKSLPYDYDKANYQTYTDLLGWAWNDLDEFASYYCTELWDWYTEILECDTEGMYPVFEGELSDTDWYYIAALYISDTLIDSVPIDWINDFFAERELELDNDVVWIVEVSHTPRGEFNDGYYDKSFNSEDEARNFAYDYADRLSKIFCKNGGMNDITHKSVIVTEINSDASLDDPRAKIAFYWSQEID